MKLTIDKKTCLWSQESLDSDCWNTSCGDAFAINEGTPKENKMIFCPYCGKRIKQEAAKER